MAGEVLGPARNPLKALIKATIETQFVSESLWIKFENRTDFHERAALIIENWSATRVSAPPYASNYGLVIFNLSFWEIFSP
ncbi:hypothetical protein [Plastoroseomonas hellenica]|uniref:hypothetical protein n=1 Tax=Plastoroseomonas hellenica TaxID=2687306 RepID=UPI001BAC3AFC|nr:hypothetical protein [Plastoroseomonas hellenica]MBR0646738.1 hypothetical protein [Plastoroseomonas hellenica]